jgi:DNA-binding winged helix-turn-helix (wHTH) protein
MLGRFLITLVGHSLGEDGWLLRKPLQLHKCLLSRPRHRVNRDLLIEWLWPDSAPDAARITLRSTLHALRRTLEAAGLERLADLIVVDREGIGLASSADLSVDADTFEELLAAARSKDDPLPMLEQADALYAGELLPDDRYEEWLPTGAKCSYERGRDCNSTSPDTASSVVTRTEPPRHWDACSTPIRLTSAPARSLSGCCCVVGGAPKPRARIRW